MNVEEKIAKKICNHIIQFEEYQIVEGQFDLNRDMIYFTVAITQDIKETKSHNDWGNTIIEKEVISRDSDFLILETWDQYGEQISNYIDQNKIKQFISDIHGKIINTYGTNQGSH